MPEEDSEEGEPEEAPETEEQKDTSSSEEKEETMNNEDKHKSEENNKSSTPGTVQLSVRSLIIGVFVLGLALGFSGGVLTSSGTSLLEAPGDTVQPPENNNDGQQETETINMNEIEMEGEPVLGQEDAPVTMVVYEDFECPFCKRFEEGAIPQIKSNYVDSGQVKIVWKDRPLGMHPWADPAAAAMECVYREAGNDVFWAVKNKVFANQDSVETSNVESQIKSWAAEEGASESAIQSCIDNDNPMEEVNADSSEGQELGASGTPTAFINGQKLVGAQPYSSFEPVIESALS